MKTHKISSSVQDGIGQGKSQQPLLGILCGASLMLAVASVQAASDSPTDQTGWQLEGTWVISVSGVPGPSPHLVFGSFLRGGVMVASPDIYLPPPIARMDSGLGVWERTGGKEFAATFAGNAYDGSGQLINIIKINSSFRLTGKDSFEGSGQLLICDLSLDCPLGGPGSSTLSGTRLQVVPLNEP